jgi:hypothetical protein
MTSQNFISQKREGRTEIRKSPSFPLCQREMKGAFGSVVTALLILSGPAVVFAASGDNSLTRTNIFAPLSTPAHAIYQNALLVLTICAAIFLVVGGLLAYTIFRFRRRPEHENLEPPQVYGSNQIITHSITILTYGWSNFRKFLVEGTKPNLKKINEYVERSLMLVTALSPVIGYDKASKIAHYAMDNDLTLKAAALKLGFVNEEEFDRVVDPRKMVKPYVAAAK